MIKVIKEVSKDELYKFLYDINVEDKKLYDEINTLNYINIFQFSGATAEKLAKEIHPDTFEELVILNSTARPGTIDFVPDYVRAKYDGYKKYPDAVHNALDETLGIPIFQEQTMLLFNKIGGFSLEETNMVRGLMKKLGKADKKKEDVEKWQTCVNTFVKGAVKNGLTKEQAESVADDLLKLSSYNFNKCFSGNCVIDKDNWKCVPLTIKEMYLTMNDGKWAKENGHRSLHDKYKREGYGRCYSLNEDGRLRLNKIVNIYPQGTRNTFRITLESGKYIDVSSNHKFPVGNVEKSLDSGLSIGDELYVNVGYEKTKIKYNFSDFLKDTRPFKEYEGEGFKNGEDNAGYINGEFLKFKLLRKELKERADGVCQKCGNKTKRLEIHHIDRNRKNNMEENLIALCVSCHKKEDYSSGRAKKGDKGLLVNKEKIVNIEQLEEEEIFDVEMEHPFHTLSVNKIVASNSHAVAYTYNAIMTLYLTVYFRTYYYAATLTYLNQNKKEDLLDAIARIKQHGISVLPPDINLSNKEFTPIGDKEIRFGLIDIKFVGEKPVQTVIENRPYRNLTDFIIKTVKPNSGMNERVVKALVSSGAFDSIDENRKKLLYIVDEFFERKKSTKVEEKLITLLQGIEKEASVLDIKTTQLDFIDYEKEFFEYNFFHSYFTDELKKRLYEAQKRGLVDLGFSELYPKVSKRIPVILNSMRVHIDKNGNEMVFVEFEDMHGTKNSMPIFASIFKSIKDTLKINHVYLTYFYLSEDDGKVMFGRNKWIDSDAEKKALAKEIQLKE